MTLLGMPQGKSHLILLAISTGCLSNMQRGGEGDRQGSEVHGSAGGQEEIASGPAREEGLRNDVVCESEQHKNSLRADAAGWFTFNYVH